MDCLSFIDYGIKVLAEAVYYILYYYSLYIILIFVKVKMTGISQLQKEESNIPREDNQGKYFF